MRRKNIPLCKKLRKNQTEAERKLWYLLRNKQMIGVKFRRQFPIGNYILDFYAPRYKLAIEADGEQHYEEEGRLRDEKRAEELGKFGIRIIRFSDFDILTNIEGVWEVIQREIRERGKQE
ncbi:MAG TPA: endonuclease domain-containing protein [bacterium]|nr:endonuclease domain-containing protein [bacterium]